jgi:hypothetical protein
VDSILKIYKLVNEQPRTKNPPTPQVTLWAKEIHEAIDIKAGVSDADASDFL